MGVEVEVVCSRLGWDSEGKGGELEYIGDICIYFTGRNGRNQFSAVSYECEEVCRWRPGSRQEGE